MSSRSLQKLARVDKSASRSKKRSTGALVFRRLHIEQFESRNLLAVLTWSPGVDLPAPRAAAAAILTPSQTILVVGGGTTTVNQLSSGASSWGAASSIDIARVSPGVGSTGLLLLVYGGASGNTPLEEALTYDPYNLDNVQDATPLHTPRTQFGFATDGSKPFAIGGLGSGNSVLSTVERYNVAQDSWTVMAPLPQSRFAFAAVDDGAGHIFTFGGATTNSASSVSNTVYRYTVATNTWDTVASMLTSTRDSAAVLASNNRIYVLGGSSGSGAIATVQSYDPVTNTWRTESDLPAARSSAAAVSDALGRIEVIGGYNQNHVALSTVIVSQQLNVPDVAPTITSTAPTSTLTGSTYTYQVVATGNPQPSYALTTAPSGMSIDAATGLITWTPTVPQAGLNNVTVRATNVAGFVDQSFSVRALTPAPTAPTGLIVTGTTTNSVSLSWNPSADSVGVAGYRVYRVGHTGFHGTVTTYTQYADVPGTSDTVTVPTAGTSYTFVVSAYNASGNVSGHSSSVSATTLSSPSYYGPTSVGVVANHPLSFTLSTSGNPSTFTYTPISVAAGMTVNPSAGLVTWTPTDSAVGTANYSFSITNGVGTVTAVVAVQVSPNLPNVSYTQSGAAVASQPYSIQFSQVSDPYNTASVTYSLVTAPAGATIDANTGLVNWTPTAADVGTANFTVRTTNYAGVRDTALVVPVYFASAVQNVVASGVTTTAANISWDAPAVSVNPIVGYHIRATYVTHSGRFNTTHTLSYETLAGVTSIALTGLPTSKTINVTVTAYDAANNSSLSGTTHFSTAYATPTIIINGGPFAYDGAGHAVSAQAKGIGGVTVSGSFYYTYNGLDTLPTEPGVYAVEAIFTSADSYYADTVATGVLTIAPAQPTVIIDGGPTTYDGVPHAASAIAYGIDGVTPVSGSFTFSYEGSPVAPSNPGVYAVVASFTSNDLHYANTSVSGVLTISTTGILAPSILLVGANVTYDGAAHALSAAAYQTNGVTPLAGTFSTFIYDGQATLPTEAGAYIVTSTFSSRDLNYADATVLVSLTIVPAAPTVEIYGDATYDGQSHVADAWAFGVNGFTTLWGSFTFAYDGSPDAPVNAGVYTVAATFTSNDPNYADTTVLGSLTISQAEPYILIDSGPYDFDGLPHGASATPFGVDGATVSGQISLTYDGLVTLPTSPGPHIVEATFTSTDPNYLSVTTTSTLLITPAVQLIANDYDPSIVDLVWTGSAGADQVKFDQLDATTIRVTTTLQNGIVVNSIQTYTGVTGSLFASGNAGNDTINASGLQTMQAQIDGGTGNNTIYGGHADDTLIGGSNGGEGQQGSNIIIGSDGNDTIFGNNVVGAEGSTGGDNLILGGNGDDVIYGSFAYAVTKYGDYSPKTLGGKNLIVGGAGNDTIFASQDADGAEGGNGSILITDSTTLSQAALSAVLAEWTSADSYSLRVARIQGLQSGGLNGANYLTPGGTVRDDGSTDQVFSDSMGSLNWLLLTIGEDIPYRLKTDEVVSDVQK